MDRAEELRKRLGDRKAFEWFMRIEDERYWKMTQRLVEKRTKEMTMLVKKNMVITWLIFIFICCVNIIRRNH